LIVDDSSDGQTERERRLLTSFCTSALAFTAWLTQQGIGNPQNLLSIVVENGGYENIFFTPDNASYEGIHF